LDPAETEAIERHLQECETCRAEVSALRSVYRSIRAIGPTDHVAPARLVAYRAGDPEVSGSERRSIRTHVEACHACGADLLTLERAEARERGRTAGALSAVASVVIVVTAGWGLASWRTEWPGRNEPVAITFRAPQRGEATETTLPGDGPWLVRIWLPVHA